MPDPTNFAQLRQDVHDACVEANKGIFTHLEGVLLRLVDAIEAGSTGKAELIHAVDAYLENDSSASWDRLYTARDAAGSTAQCGRCGGSHFTRDHVKVMDAAERRERDGGQ